MLYLVKNHAQESVRLRRREQGEGWRGSVDQRGLALALARTNADSGVETELLLIE